MYNLLVQHTTGEALAATIQRQSDGFYWSVTNSQFEAAPAFVDKQINLTEGVAEDASSYSAAVGSLGSPGPVNVRIHDTGAANITIQTFQVAVEGDTEVYTSSLTRAGSEIFTYTALIDGSIPLSGTEVWITVDSAGTNVIASGLTDVSGEVTFLLDPSTYYLWQQKPGFDFTNNPQEITVTATP